LFDSAYKFRDAETVACRRAVAIGSSKVGKGFASGGADLEVLADDRLDGIEEAWTELARRKSLLRGATVSDKRASARPEMPEAMSTSVVGRAG
jgi:hypothetical protein